MMKINLVLHKNPIKVQRLNFWNTWAYPNFLDKGEDFLDRLPYPQRILSLYRLYKF